MKLIWGARYGSIILALVGSVYLVYCIGFYTRAHDPERADYPNSTALSVPTTQSEYLRDVIEPIAMVEGIIWDNASLGLVFEDLRQTRKSVCLLRLYEGSDDPLKQNLLLGTALPHVQEGKRIPVAGAEERAFLGLLERWYRDDPEAQGIAHRIGMIAGQAKTKERHPYYDPGKTKEYGGKVIAIEIMRVLRKRD